MFFRKIKILHICIAIILILGAVFSYHVVNYIRSRILITLPIIGDFNESDRSIFEKELGIKFVENTMITESKYTPGIDPSFDLIFTFPEDEMDGFCKGIADYYIEQTIRYPQTQGQITLKGTYLKGYDHRKKAFTSLVLYKADANMVIAHMNYSDPSSRLIKILLDKVRWKPIKNGIS